MAFPSVFSSSILVFSLLIIVSAADYSSTPKPDNNGYTYNPAPKPDYVKPVDQYTPKPDAQQYTPKPDEQNNVKPDHSGYAPKPEGQVGKSEDNYIPKPEQENVKPDHSTCVTKPEAEAKKPKGEYNPKPEEDNVKPDHIRSSPKPEGEVVKPEDKYTPKPNFEQSKPNYGNLPIPDTVKQGYENIHELENPLPIGIEGLVLCKLGSSFVPVEGAVARITCAAVDKTTTLSCLSGATDAKGYFFELLPVLGFNEDDTKLSGCEVKLESSPLQNCDVPTDVNKGISGALISSFRILRDKKIKLYSVGPFFYTSKAQQPSSPSSTSTTTGY